MVTVPLLAKRRRHKVNMRGEAAFLRVRNYRSKGMNTSPVPGKASARQRAVRFERRCTGAKEKPATGHGAGSTMSVMVPLWRCFARRVKQDGAVSASADGTTPATAGTLRP